MSDKSATTRLPPGWTGTAPDADAIFAMAEAALETLVAPDREPASVADLLPLPKQLRNAG